MNVNNPPRKRVHLMKMSMNNTLLDDMILGFSGMQGVCTTMENVHYKKILIVKRKKVKTITILGIFDGHGGVEVAGFLKDNLFPMLIEVIEKQINDLNYPLNRILERDKEIIDIFHECDYKCCDEFFKKEFGENSGSTFVGSIVVAYDDGLIDVITLTVGNSRSFLYDRGEVLPLSPNHLPVDKEETVRVEKNEGFVSDGRIHRKDMKRFAFQTSRTFGDFSFKPRTVGHIQMGRDQIDPTKAEEELDDQLIIVKPGVTRYRVKLDEIGGMNPYRFVVLGCDGVFGKLTGDRVCGFVLKRLKELEEGDYFEKRLKRLKRIYRNTRLPVDLIPRRKTNGEVDKKTTAFMKGERAFHNLEKYDLTTIAEELLDHCVWVERRRSNCSIAIVVLKGEEDWI